MILSLLFACGTGSITLDQTASSPCAEGFYLEEDGNCYPNSTDSDDTARDTDRPHTGETGEDTGEDTAEDSGGGDSGGGGDDTAEDSGGGDTDDTGDSGGGGDTGGDDTGEPEPEPTEYTETDIEFVYVGAIHYCAKDVTGFVSCFTDPRETGYDAWHVPITPEDLTAVTFSDVSVNQYYSCGIREDDQTVECWGDTDSYGTVPTSTTFDTISSIPSDESTSYLWTCGATTTGTVECWGGLDASGNETVPEEIAAAGLTDVSDLCIGGYGGMSFLCTQDETDGEVSCMNIDLDSSLDSATSKGPIVDGTLTCGKEQACGILADEFGISTGEIDCWGLEWEVEGVATDSFGTVVGPFTGEDDEVYYDTTSTSLFDTVAAGPHWNCATATDGTFGCFGSTLSSTYGLNDEILSEDNIDDNSTLGDAIFTHLSLSGAALDRDPTLGGGCGVDIQTGDSVVNCWGYFFDW